MHNTIQGLGVAGGRYVLYIVSYVCDMREIQKLESSKRMKGSRRRCAHQNIRIVPCYPHFTAQNNFTNKEL